MGTQKSLRVLLVEDDPRDATLCRTCLERAGYNVHAGVVASAEEFVNELRSAGYDIVLADYQLPGWSGMDALETVKRERPDLPFIVVTATIGEEAAAECIKRGATDYVLKDRLARLPLAVERALADVVARSERQKAERARDFLASIVESSGDAIIGSTLDGTVLSWNAGAKQIFGYAAEGIEGQSIALLFDADGREALQRALESLRRGHKVDRYETHGATADNRAIEVALTMSPIRNAEGDLAGGSVVIRDITDQKKLQREFYEAQRMEEIGRLAAGVAHDFNNLLGAILAQSELATEEAAAGSRPEEELKAIQALAISGSEIVRQLMMYAGSESESFELVDLSRIVEEMIELLKVSTSKHATLETDLGRDLPPVRANPAQIRQVVLNLVTNASEAIGVRQGVIRVTTRRVTVGRDSSVEVREALTEGDYLQVQVSDSGAGMPPEIQTRVFDPFFTTKPKGHGLGLAAVQGIVRGLRGAIQLASAPGKGTTFQILLPCAETTAGAPSKPTPRTAEGDRILGATILVVEDEDKLRQAVSKMMRKLSYSVIEASDGSAALDAIRALDERMDVLLLDLSIPGSSRQVFDEARRLRPGMRVIVTSAYGEETVAASVPGGAEHFIRKPYRLHELLDVIQMLRR
jgi:PAS domain S-box-containing protein